MTNEQKRQVRDALVRYVANFNTQAEAASHLQDVSPSTISLIKNNNWELLSENLWRNVARQVGFYSAPDASRVLAADTSCYQLLRILFSDAQHYAMTYGISIGKGLGKTFAARQYAQANADTFYIRGLEQYNRKSFVATLSELAGLKAQGTVPELMEQFTTAIKSKEEPIIIVDDAHKLKDRVLHLLVLLSNSLAGKAGIIIMGAEGLRMRIVEGVRLGRTGFDDIFKSIGKRFITLGSLGQQDAELVCHARGIFDEDLVRSISEAADNNLHNVTELINRHREMAMAA
jgi:hypothetical protein